MPDVGLSRTQRGVKRAIDLCGALVGLVLTGWIIVPAYVIAVMDTRTSGFFRQDRVGRDGKIFRIIKIRTMRPVAGVCSTVTTAKDARVTAAGRLLRRAKIDELPQLINVLAGDMSFVGPRPDVPGFADTACSDDRIILSVRPGITGPATLRFRNEEELLAAQEDPERYNREVIFPEKLRLNREYIEHYSLMNDFRYIWRTLFDPVRRSEEPTSYRAFRKVGNR